MFRCVLGCGFVGAQSRGAGGLASPGCSGPRPVKGNTKTCVDCKFVAPAKGSFACVGVSG